MEKGNVICGTEPQPTENAAMAEKTGERKNLKGTFKEPQHGNSQCEWAGFFTANPATGEFKGEIMDRYGTADIEGFVSGDVIMFTKLYRGRRDVLVYSMKKQADGKYLGRWAYAFYLGEFTWLQGTEIKQLEDARIAGAQMAEIPEREFGSYGGKATCTIG